MILPQRPLQLHRTLPQKRILGFLIIVVFSAAFLAITVWTGAKILRVRQDKAVFANGVPAKSFNVWGYQADITSLYVNRMTVPPLHSGGLWPDFVLTVEYTDAQGVVHQSERECGGPFGSVDDGPDLLVRYNPQHPDDYALSWAVAVGGNEIAGDVFEFLFLGSLAFIFAAVGWGISQEFYDARRAAEDGEEMDLQIVSAKEQFTNGQSTGMVLYRYLVPGEHKERQQSLDKEKPPLMLDESSKFMLGIRSPRNGRKVVLVSHDLFPFAFTAEEEKAIRERVAFCQVALHST